MKILLGYTQCDGFSLTAEVSAVVTDVHNTDDRADTFDGISIYSLYGFSVASSDSHGNHCLPEDMSICC